MARACRWRLLSNMVLKDAGNISLVRHNASQWNPDKCAPTCVHAFIMVGQAWQKQWLRSLGTNGELLLHIKSLLMP